jgi:tetratricopeptide (TPR) repeat protein
MVLNYLGYSWVDQNRNLKEGMSLIEKAVALKPDDGYIVDSLGWAHFKLGNFKEAVRFLERAVELKPEDPVLNDHLGDALWRVGREREARFQWDQALTLEPEPDQVEKIKKKLTKGLPPRVGVHSIPEKQRNVQLKKRKETKLTPPRVE